MVNFHGKVKERLVTGTRSFSCIRVKKALVEVKRIRFEAKEMERNMLKHHILCFDVKKRLARRNLLLCKFLLKSDAYKSTKSKHKEKVFKILVISPNAHRTTYKDENV